MHSGKLATWGVGSDLMYMQVQCGEACIGPASDLDDPSAEPTAVSSDVVQRGFTLLFLLIIIVAMTTLSLR